MNQSICEAILKRKLIELNYHGYYRLIEPYAYGRDKSGEELLRCYQLSGGSESGERIGWKLLKVNEVYSFNTKAESFEIRPNYHRNDKAMDYIFCQQ